MFTTASNQQKVYLFADPVDMRKSIDGLSALAQLYLDESIMSDHLFVFCNRKQDKLKILQWDRNGFWLHYKRLEKDHFRWVECDEDSIHICISRQQLTWLLDGLPIQQPKAHRVFTEVYGVI